MDAAEIPAIKIRATLGLHDGVSNDAYHSGDGVSKSSLWKIYSESPAHFKFPPAKEVTTQQQATRDFGTACHMAILEPEEFEKRIVRGPDDRRGNKWTDLVAYHKTTGKLVLVASAFDEVLAIRDAVHADPFIHGIITGGPARVEASGYYLDPETGALCKFRPDLYRPDIGVCVDLKSAEDASPAGFAKAVINFGYHAQEAWYSDGFTEIGLPLNGFLFLVHEKESPYAFKLYELPPSIVEEGRAIMRKALDTYLLCREADQWPAYGDGVQELAFPRWAYKETKAPDHVTEDYA